MSLRRDVGRTVLWGVLYVVATWAGRLTVLDGSNLSLVWPAAGVLAVWFMSGSTGRRRRFDIAALVVITLVVNTLTGASVLLAAVFVVANLVQATLFAALLSRWQPGLWRGGPDGRPLTRLAELWRLVAAAALSTAASALIGPTGVWLESGRYSWAATAVWLARNVVSILLVGVALHRVVQALAARRPLRLRLTVESVAVLVVSTAAYCYVFANADGLPLAFALIGLTVWAGLRLPTVFVILHDLVFGAVAVLFTLHGDGPFAQIVAHPVRALIAQVFVGTVAVVGLALALGRDERAALLARLKASERAATEQAQLLTTIIDSMTEGLGVIAADGSVLLRNPAAERLLALPGRSSRVRDSAGYGLRHADGRPVAEDELPFWLALNGTPVAATDYLVRHPGLPEGRIISLTATRLPVDLDGTGHAVIVFHDVTADRHRRVELASFAGVVAHDLLNPLATIEGWGEALHQSLTERGDDESLDCLVRIRRAATRMHNLIDGLLAFTTARDTTIAATEVDLGALVVDVAAERVDQARGSGAPVPVFTVGELAPVAADPVLTRQLLDNLIGNAVKYTAPGVVPRVLVTGGPAGGGLVRVEVSDNGIGIPAGQHEAVFADFHRAHRTAGYAGTGLGLAICRRIVERHGGTISAADNPAGSGTRMTFTLPAAGVRPDPSPANT